MDWSAGAISYVGLLPGQLRLACDPNPVRDTSRRRPLANAELYLYGRIWRNAMGFNVLSCELGSSCTLPLACR